MNKAHIKYLENRLHEIAKGANRYIIVNSSTPTQSAISESDRAEMEEFIDNIKLLVNTLGHKVFEEKREYKPVLEQEAFYIKAEHGVYGQGKPTSDGFVVFKGSKAVGGNVPSLWLNFAKFRQRLIDEGVLVKIEECYEFTEDYIFSSPSTAAIILLGRNVNGLTEWKQKDGRTLKEFESIGKTLKT